MPTTIKVKKSFEKEGFKSPVFEYRPDWPYISVGFGDEKDYFIENLSLLISSGMGIGSALSTMSASVKSWKMQKMISIIENLVTSGMPLWKALSESKMLPARVISLIRSGEESGKLPEHLNLVTVQQHKEKIFKSRLRSALLYPGIVLLLALLLALGGAWFILPNLVSIFNEAHGALPFTTQILLWLGNFLRAYGAVAIPATIALLFVLIFFIFVYKKTKFIGEKILFITPGIKALVQGIEIGRFGFVLGALLQAGFQANEALSLLTEGTENHLYRKFYDRLQNSILHGESFKSGMASYKKSKKLIPLPIQQLIVASEKSGKLPETLMKVGVIFEEKTEAMSQDLSSVLEPIILIVVGLIVGLVVSGIIGPIYGLSGQI